MHLFKLLAKLCDDLTLVDKAHLLQAMTRVENGMVNRQDPVAIALAKTNRSSLPIEDSISPRGTA